MSRVRILLADDFQAMLEKVSELLEPEFEVVGTVCDGQSLLESAAELNPDVVVIDVSMPVLNGFQAAERLRGLGSAAKVVFLTVHSEPEMVREAFENGGLAYVFKHLLASDLVPAIHKVLGGHTFVSKLD